MRTHHTGQTSPTLGDRSCSRNSKNYFSDVTFNYFYSDSRKVSRIKADVLTPVKIEHRTTADIYNARLSCVIQWSALYRGGKPGTKTSYHRWSRYRSCGSELPTARKPWYIFYPDFVEIATILTVSTSARHCLSWIICHRRFNYSLSFALFCRRVLARQK